MSFNSSREELYQESTSHHLDLIEDMQKTISTHVKRIAELEYRNAYLEKQMSMRNFYDINRDVEYWESQYV